MKNFAETVYDYFKNRMEQTGEPLNDTESIIFKEAEKLKNKYPISFLSADDLRQLNYIVTEEDEKKLPCLSEALGLEYKEWYCDTLDNLAYANGFVRCNAYDMMLKDYKERVNDSLSTNELCVVVQYKNEKIPVMATIGIGNSPKTDEKFILTVKDAEELKPYFERDNRYGFYIVEHLDFY